MNNIDEITAYLYAFGVKHKGCKGGQKFLETKPNVTKTTEFLLSNLGSIIGRTLKDDDNYDSIMTFLLENFDRGEFDWTEFSSLLSVRCSEYFDKWFDSKGFNWNRYSWVLSQYCAVHFDKWFDAEKYDWACGSVEMAVYCPEHFEKWFDPKKFNWNAICELEKHCSAYRHIWGKYIPELKQDRPS